MINLNEMRKAQVASFGAIHEPMDINSVDVFRLQCRESMQKEFEHYVKNPSASNWNALTIAMMWHQYWMQKAIYEVVEE